ncbi:MAG: hypothetical protein QM493_04765 [Sulfurovum sp.]
MMNKKSYILKHFDKNLIEFRFIHTPLDGCIVEIISVNSDCKEFFPLGLDVENSSLLSWLKSRTIPKNRHFVYKILMELNLSFDDIEGIVSISKSLSVNDVYWIVDSDFMGYFEDYNLYDNDFNKTLSLLAYTGYASVKQKGFISSPEFTTNGMLAKAWRRDPQGKKGIFLYKSGSDGCANCGKEPYSEFYAFQIASAMELDITLYNLSRWKGRLNSTCILFCTKEVSFIPIYHLVSDGGWSGVLNYYQSLGDNYYNALVDMLIFDVIIVNTDRHFGNFGFLVDNHTNQILKTAPIFDNGLSLFHDGLDDDLSEIKRYAQTKSMKNAGDFMAFAKSIMSSRVKKNLRKLINFKFTKHPTYNLPHKRLEKIEKFVGQRVLELLAL